MHHRGRLDFYQLYHIAIWTATTHSILDAKKGRYANDHIDLVPQKGVIVA